VSQGVGAVRRRLIRIFYFGRAPFEVEISSDKSSLMRQN
jgi:hypothetical protein